MSTIPDSTPSVLEAKASIPAQAAETERFQAGRVLTITAGHAVHDTYTAFLPPLLPVFIANLALSKTEAGLLTVFIQGPSLLQPFIGHLADRANLRYFVVLAPAATAALMSLLGVAPGYVVLALFLVVVGFSSACLQLCGAGDNRNPVGAETGPRHGFLDGRRRVGPHPGTHRDRQRRPLIDLRAHPG